MSQLADMASICSVPGHLIDARITAIYKEIEHIAARMEGALGKGDLDRLAEVLGIAIPEPTKANPAPRVCVCIWLDSFLAQERLADSEKKFVGCARYLGLDDVQLVDEVSLAWSEILDVNYAAIFMPARETLKILTVRGGEFLRDILAVARNVVADSLHHILDIGGELLPRLAPDRKATAAFYTLRESADLLTGLVPESCYRELAARRGDRPGLVGDFACGTGSLLVSAYRRIRRQIDAAGGKPDKHHRWWMEEGLFGVDIQPIAVHLTAMRLSSFAMKQKYKRANIIYAGLDGSGSTGALELLDRPKLLDLFPVEDGKDVEDLHAPAPDDRFGLCVMNPPYTRTKKGQSAFRVSQLDQAGTEASKKRQSVLTKGTFANGMAGMASAFAALADKKLAEDGVYASVLPASAASASSWAGFRKNLRERYSDVLVASATSAVRRSFSADTGMAELFVVARKGETPESVFHFISLYEFPRNAVETEAFVHAIRSAVSRSRPGLPTPIRVGVAVVGNCLAYKVTKDEVWAPANVRDLSLIGYAGKFHGHADMQPMKDVFEVGPSHDSIGHLEGNNPRGAFTFLPAAPDVTPNHPSLWARDHENQHTILTAPTHDGEPMPGRGDLQKRMLEQRSRFFFARDLGFGAQTTSIAYTERLCLGGPAWAGLRTDQPGMDKALCLWSNSIFGLAWRWFYGGKQHDGRSRYQIDSVHTFPIPRFDEKAVRVAEENFEEIIRLSLRTCAFIQWDPNRQRIDSVVRDMLGFGKDMDEDVDQLRRRWCREPGVNRNRIEIIKLLKADGMLA